LRLRNLLPAILLIPTLATAQTVQIDFGDAGEREVWISDRIALPPASLKTGESKLTLPKQGGPTDRIFVWDRKTGNVASKGTTEMTGVWKVKPEDFKLAGKVTVKVEHDSKPVAVAFVKLKDAAGEKDLQIDASKKGEAVFFGVRPGNVQVTVRYNSNGSDAEPAAQAFVLDLRRPTPDPVFTISLNQPVETVEGTVSDPEPQKSDSATTPAASSTPRRSLIGNIVVYLLGLGVAVAIIYFGLRYAKQNQDKVKAQLEKVGVQIPDPQGATPDPAPAPVPTAPAPPQKILLDDAAPVASDPPVPATLVSSPSLVMDNGDVFSIPDGDTSVGREAGNALSLVTESTVSRRHATLVRSGASVAIRDEGSSNGTYVNGVKISSETELKPGDQVQFGEVRFRFEA
jgi:hypothetical protein